MTNKKFPLVSIIIVNFNGLHFLKNCIPGLYSQEYKNIEIIVVDNDSTDKSTVWLEGKYSDINVIKNSCNEGFANANNIGYRHAKGEYVLFLNNDTEVTKQFLSRLVEKMESDKSIGCLSGKILLMRDKMRFDAIGAFLTPTGFLFHYGFYKKDTQLYDKELDLYTVKGACMMLRNSVLEKILVDGNVFDPSFFAYFEETDLCHRILLAGYRISYIPTSVIYHHMGGTSTKLHDAFVQFHSFKNRIHSYMKNFGTWTLLHILPVHIVFCIGAAWAFLLKGNIALFIAIHKAIGWNILHSKEIFYERTIVQHHIRIREDAAFLPALTKHPSISYYIQSFLGGGVYKDDVL